MTLETVPEPDPLPEPVVTRFDGGEARAYYEDYRFEVVIDGLDLDFDEVSTVLEGDRLTITLPMAQCRNLGRTTKAERERWASEQRWAFPLPDEDDLWVDDSPLPTCFSWAQAAVRSALPADGKRGTGLPGADERARAAH